MRSPSLPHYPQNKTHRECIRYILQNMRPDDPGMDFIASLFSYCIKFKGVTEAQAEALRPYYEHWLET